MTAGDLVANRLKAEFSEESAGNVTRLESRLNASLDAIGRCQGSADEFNLLRKKALELRAMLIAQREAGGAATNNVTIVETTWPIPAPR